MPEVEVPPNHSPDVGAASKTRYDHDRLQAVQNVHNHTHAASPKVKQMMLSSTFATGLFFSAPLITDAALGDQPLTEGMSHPDVKQLQEALKEKGHFTYHTATGYYGSITAEAVSSFQRAQGLPVSGQATRATLDQLLTQSERSSVKAAAASSALSTQQVLRQGTSSSQVASLQRQLKQAGHFQHEVTGYYGRITTESVRSFQRANRLSVDGIAGPQTLNALQNTTAVTIEQVQPSPAPAKATPAQTNAVIRLGSSGQAVSDLQQRLRDLGYFQGSVNGQFSESTRDAVRRFQQQQRIAVDGIVGPQTWRSLNSATTVAAPTPAPAKPTVQPPAPAPSAPQTGSTVLRIGQQGAAVSNLQSQLKVIGLFNQEPTGYYGTVTEQAVRAFQRQQGLTTDGIAGPKTIQQLNKLAGNPPSGTSEFNVMNLVADASEQLGVPYVWGGTTTAGFDCSGFLQFVFAKSGVQLPRTVAAMWDVGSSINDPRVGDLVFFETYAPGPSHAGIYIGNGQFVHSGSSTGVTIANMSTAYWNDRYIGAKRMF